MRIKHRVSLSRWRQTKHDKPLIFFALIQKSDVFLIRWMLEMFHDSQKLTLYRPLYTMMSHFTAFGRITHRWVALRPLAQLQSDGPLCGPFQIYSTLPEIGNLPNFTYSWRTQFNLNIFASISYNWMFFSSTHKR